MSNIKTNENNVSIKEQINKLTIIQSKIIKLHKNLLLLLKGYSYNIDSTNITKKYASKISGDISEIQKNIDSAIKIESLIRKLLSRYKEVEIKRNSEKDDFSKNFLLSLDDYIVQISKIYNAIEDYIEEHKNLLDLALDKTSLRMSDSSKTSPYEENTLLISETQNKVILPYTMQQINDYIEKHSNKKLSIQNVIDKLYTIPLTAYKHSVLSRFSEAYKLIKQKEHGSVKEALDLAFELAFNYSLHPAIITACNTLDELDIYLACLEYNELDSFRFFNINFEIAPTLSE